MDVTVTIFVERNSLSTLMNVLQTLDTLNVDNDYTFQPKDIVYSETMISKYIWVNVHIDLYYKFKSKFLELTK